MYPTFRQVGLRPTSCQLACVVFFFLSPLVVDRIRRSVAQALFSWPEGRVRVRVCVCVCVCVCACVCACLPAYVVRAS